MLHRTRIVLAFVVALMPAALMSQASAEGQAWRIGKSSGEFSVTTSGAQPASLTSGTLLQPGDSIRTGQNGRVLLVRGNETILISANSSVSIPKDKKDGLSTLILHQAGSIMLEVEKRGASHFEVETPHLSAVVKGTRFQVAVNPTNTRVSVFQGQVEVADLKSGQHALVHPGQTARASERGAGLSVNGSGALSPIQQGTPRRPSASPSQEPQEGLSVPGATPSREVRLPQLAEASAIALPERSPGQSDWWSSDLIAAGEQDLKIKKDELALSLGFPLFVGTLVAIGVALRRRKQRMKQERAL